MMIRYLILSVFALLSTDSHSQTPSKNEEQSFSIKNCVNQFTTANIESTKVGYQYWFVGQDFIDGRTLKLSVVRPHEATHAPHSHPEDEFFFVLEGTAEFFLNGETAIGKPYSSFYCPPNSRHGIRNVGDTVLKYLVIKKYPKSRDQGSVIKN